MIYAVNDIHGDLAMYSHIVNMLKGDDLLYIVGDVIDRGSSGIAILRDIMKRTNVELLFGNHEWMLLQSLLLADEDIMGTWLSKKNGGQVTAETLLGLPTDESDEILSYLASRKICEQITIDNQKFVLVHGCYLEGIENVKQFEDTRLVQVCLWDSSLYSYVDDKNTTDIYIHGHVPIGNAGLSNPYLENSRYIDGGNIFGGCQILYNLNTDTCTYLKHINGKIKSKEVSNT